MVHLPLVSSGGSLKAYTASHCGRAGRWYPLLAAAAIACSDADPSDGMRGGDGGVPGHDGGSQVGNAGSASGASGAGAASNCEQPGPGMPYEYLTCTGLYADIAAKRLAPGVEPFTPAVQLWSDGAAKQRWVQIPAGMQIDASNPENWQFPIGTKFWKEFSWKGKRVETRLFWKIEANRWVKATYHWNEAETEATQHVGGEVKVGADTYLIPSAKECDQCHKGRTDRALGFEPLLLGLPGATGMTLAKLTSERRLAGNTFPASPQIGDDGTGKGAAALGWLHVNCGVSCHNDNSAAEGYSSDLRLQLVPALASGGSTANAPARRTGIGVTATTLRWRPQKRIVAGSPQDSLLHFLIRTRDPSEPKDRMPPIASRLVDTDGVKLIEDWIRAMPR